MKILHLLDLSQVAAHLAHQVSKLLKSVRGATGLPSLDRLVAVVHSIDVAELLVKKGRDEIALLPDSGDGLDDLVEVQVRCG